MLGGSAGFSAGEAVLRAVVQLCFLGDRGDGEESTARRLLSFQFCLTAASNSTDGNRRHLS
jgi:hypothetical protein